MGSIEIEGARLIGETWHYYKRIPVRLREAYSLPEFKRGSMKTKDPDQARRLARSMLTELDELGAKLDSVSARLRVFGDLSPAGQEAVKAEADSNVAALPPDQRQLIRKAGGVFEAGRDMRRQEVTAAFLEAGRGADFDMMDVYGDEYDPDEREEAEVTQAASAAMRKRKGTAIREALSAAKVIDTDVQTMTLRGAMERFCGQKGYIHTETRKNKTRGQYEYAVRRFMEYTGPVALADLTRRHLADFAADFLRLPKAAPREVAAMAFWDVVKAADKANLHRVSPRTRDQNIVFLKSLMGYSVKEELRPGPDPWSRYTVTAAQEKVSEKRKRKPYVFSRDDMRAIIAHVSATRHHDTIDYWGPLLGAHHGMRIEEYCQTRVQDFTTEEGHLCINITDAGDDQSVKTSNSFRTIPIHPKLIELGFADYIRRRREAGADFLFLSQERWGGELVELTPNSYGRLAEAYGKRFKKTDLQKVGISGYRAGSHSFRHGWTDLARGAGMDPEHRLALAGRDADSDFKLLDATEKRYGHGFSIATLAASLALVNVLDDPADAGAGQG
ncbi:MAG: site-specific integrase [Paracoccaceae bacterium]